jgi:hypothetical protein
LGITYYTGLVRDATDKRYYLFDKALGISNPCNEVDFTGITYSDLVLGRLEIKRPLEEGSLKIADAECGDIMIGISGEYHPLDLGLNGQVLTVNREAPLCVTWDFNAGGNIKGESGSWVEKLTDYKYTRVSSNITLIGGDIYTRLFRKKYYGTKTYSIINEIEDGPAGLFYASKSCRDIDGHIVKLTGMDSYTGGLTSKWTRRVNIEAAKCTEDSDGDYLAICNYDPKCAPESIRDNFQEKVNLIGTTYSKIDNAKQGNLMFQVENDIKGPVGIFYLSKGMENISGHIAKISHSPSSDFNKLEMRWNANSCVELHKTKSTFDGEYRVIPIHNQYLSEQIITLTGNNFATETFIDIYERVVTIVSVESLDTNGANAIFTISKNHIDNKFHYVRVVGSSSGSGWDNCEIIGIDPPSINDIPTNCLIVNGCEIVGVEKKCRLAVAPDPEKIELVWDEDELLKIRKNNCSFGSNVYDGLYRVRVYDYFPC